MTVDAFLMSLLLTLNKYLSTRDIQKKVFLKISENWQENTCARVFLVAEAWGLQLYFKKKY